MSTDIHTVIEVKKKGKWYPIEDVLYTLQGGEAEHAYMTHYKEGGDFLFKNDSYPLMSLFAGVRNPIVLPDDRYIKPISEPRGIPKDCHVITRLMVEEFGPWAKEAHSHSWLTLKEIMSADWNQKFHSGFLVADGNPQMAVEQMRKAGHIPMDATVRVEFGHTTVEGFFTLRQYCHRFLDETLPALQRACGRFKVSEDEMRIVFWFDN